MNFGIKLSFNHFSGHPHSHDDDQDAFKNDHDTEGHPYKKPLRLPDGAKDDDHEEADMKKLFDQWMAERQGKKPEMAEEGPKEVKPDAPYQADSENYKQEPGNYQGLGQKWSPESHTQYDQYGREIENDHAHDDPRFPHRKDEYAKVPGRWDENGRWVEYWQETPDRETYYGHQNGKIKKNNLILKAKLFSNTIDS